MTSLSSSSTAILNLPLRTKAALHHLQTLRPLDGYSVDNFVSTTGKTLWRLKRRGVPLCDDGFLEIVVIQSGTTSTATGSSISSSISETTINCEGCTVGIQVLTSKGDVGRGTILVNRDGSVAGNKVGGRVITVSMANTLNCVGKIHTNTAAEAHRSRDGLCSFMNSSPIRHNTATNRSSTGSIDNPFANMSNDQMVQYAFLAFGGLVALKIIFSLLLGGGLGIVLLPVLYYYALQNCPNSESFDAKRELKRVMRGTHLPEDQQPKGFFEQGLNRLAASISTELATSLGYECEITNYFGAAKMAFVRVPVAGTDFYWIGVFGKWRFIGQKEVPQTKTD
eukprot:CAMPEP_0171399762 /NCGR_PEP_ID=MMETSP0880-20121228/6833_1 /TAXON_ID=67004 /ORGANISM="Thalassiosira weissflogii, Strain CCMP1336" /LENGTH=337 /DNA_ID=CAMNT_0011913977 /DNA_START=38 /DNA_END=1051 /DNA_ORIENTATION=-